MCLTTNVDPSKCWGTLKYTKLFLKKVLAQNPEETGSWSLGILKKSDPEETGSWSHRILKKPDPEDFVETWFRRLRRHTEETSRWRLSWSVVFVKSFSFLSLRKTSYCWRGWRKRVPKFWGSAQLGILKKNPEEISYSRSSVLGCLRHCSSGHWGN